MTDTNARIIELQEAVISLQDAVLKLTALQDQAADIIVALSKKVFTDEAD